MKNLSNYSELHWWNMGKKTLSFKGELKDLLKDQNISFRKVKTEREGIYKFYFKSQYGVTFTTTGTLSDYAHHAKQFIQMELVRMGDKSQLYVSSVWRPTVNVNF